MHWELFEWIFDKVGNFDDYFVDKFDGVDNLNVLGSIKTVAAIRMRASGQSRFECEEYLYLGASTANEALSRFCNAFIVISEEYMYALPATYMARIYAQNKTHGFPVMLGSIDCMHWL